MKFLLLASAFVTAVSAHATWQQMWIGNTDYGTKCTHIVANNNPILDLSSPQLRCNNIASRALQKCTVAAGGKLTVEMHQQHDQRDCGNEAIGGAHHGPVLIYMSKVNDALTADGSTPFFKVFEAGLYDPDKPIWGNDIINQNCGHQEFTVPADLAPGDYLVRAETIALHSAGQPGGAQPYVSCFAVTVTGSGTANPPGVVWPGAYKANDPGLLINLYYPKVTTYKAPGPPVYGRAVATQ